MPLLRAVSTKGAKFRPNCICLKLRERQRLSLSPRKVNRDDDACSQCGMRLERAAFDAHPTGLLITQDSQDENVEINLMALRTKSDRPQDENESPSRLVVMPIVDEVVNNDSVETQIKRLETCGNKNDN